MRTGSINLAECQCIFDYHRRQSGDVRISVVLSEPIEMAHPLYQMQVLDMASGGPVGSLEVLWTTMPGLATIGALLMISSVAVPLAQQVLSFPERIVPAPNETAYIQAAHEYRPRWTEGAEPSMLIDGENEGYEDPG